METIFTPTIEFVATVTPLWPASLNGSTTDVDGFDAGKFLLVEKQRELDHIVNIKIMVNTQLDKETLTATSITICKPP